MRYYLLLLFGWATSIPLMAGSAERTATSVAVLTAPTSFTSKIAVIASPTINVPTAADYRNGVTISQASLQVSGTPATYTLTVRASGVNLTSGTNTIPVNLIGVTVTTPNIGATPEKRLTTTAQTLVSYTSPTAFANTNLTVQYRLYSDVALLKPAGNYTTTLTFTLTP